MRKMTEYEADRIINSFRTSEKPDCMSDADALAAIEMTVSRKYVSVYADCLKNAFAWYFHLTVARNELRK